MCLSSVITWHSPQQQSRRNTFSHISPHWRWERQRRSRLGQMGAKKRPPNMLSAFGNIQKWFLVWFGHWADTANERYTIRQFVHRLMAGRNIETKHIFLVLIDQSPDSNCFMPRHSYIHMKIWRYTRHDSWRCRKEKEKGNRLHSSLTFRLLLPIPFDLKHFQELAKLSIFLSFLLTFCLFLGCSRFKNACQAILAATTKIANSNKN